jgi:hypothetical protein
MKALDDILRERTFDREDSYTGRLNVCFQPDSFADFHEHLEFSEVFAKFTRNDRFRGLDVARLWSLILNLKQVLSRVDGAVAELGVYKGHSSAVIGHYARQFGRRMYLLDTFSGFVQEQIESPLSQTAKHAFRDVSLEYAQETVGASELFEWIVGPFPDSITPALQDEKYSFVSLDCDLYDPILAGLRFFYPRLSPGGLIFVHDYSSGHWPGATRALDQFVEEAGAGHVLLPDKSGSAVVIRPNAPKGRHSGSRDPE